jgi:hypothetical protein
VRIETFDALKFELRRLGITRLGCRARIETSVVMNLAGGELASPGSDAGCGLKPTIDLALTFPFSDHPAAMPGDGIAVGVGNFIP